MRQELAVLLSPLIALVAAGPIVLLGDGRAQYGVALVAVGFLPLLLSALMIPVHFVLSKLTKGALAVYALAGAFVGVLLAILCFLAGGGLVASVFLFLWLCVSFIVFRLLINVRSERRGTTKKGHEPEPL